MLEINNVNEFFSNCEVRNFKDDKEWHKLRSHGIGGSEAGIILNVNNYKTPYQLWSEKTGLTKREFITSEAIEKGNRLEQPLIDVFEGIYKDTYKVYNTKDISLKSKKIPFMIGNLDGALEDSEGKKGVLEIKTTTIQNWSMMDNWKDDTIPMTYYCQVLHYLIVTGFDYVVLYALLDFPWMNEGHGKQETRIYIINKDDVQEDMDMIIDKEKEFWDMVLNKKAPDILNKTIRI